MKPFFWIAVLSLTSFSAIAEDVFIDEMKVEKIENQLYLDPAEIQQRTLGLTFKETHKDYYSTRRVICTAAELENCDKFRFVDTAFFSEKNRPERILVLNEPKGAYTRAEVNSALEVFRKDLEVRGVYSSEGTHLFEGTQVGFTVAHEMWVQCGNVCEIPAGLVAIPLGAAYDVVTTPYFLVKKSLQKKDAKKAGKKISALIAEGKPGVLELNMNQMMNIEWAMDRALKN